MQQATDAVQDVARELPTTEMYPADLSDLAGCFLDLTAAVGSIAHQISQHVGRMAPELRHDSYAASDQSREHAEAVQTTVMEVSLAADNIQTGMIRLEDTFGRLHEALARLAMRE